MEHLTLPIETIMKYHNQIINRRETYRKASNKYYHDKLKITDDLPQDEKQKRIEKRNLFNAKRREAYKQKKRLEYLQRMNDNMSSSDSE
jgi:DNA-binding helix-hairpin-helix protein with protein kinase domain